MFEFNKKGPGDGAAETSATAPRQQATPPAAAEPRPAAASPAGPSTRAAGGARRETAIIGPTIQIDGTLRGDEDVYIEGQVSGAIHLESHTLTIGGEGKVKANVFAHTVFVDGSMEGDLYGAEQVIVRRNARVRGNITSPRVSLEDGATFKGSIEMDPEAVKAALNSSRSGARPQTSPARPAQTPQSVASPAQGTSSRPGPVGSASGGSAA